MILLKSFSKLETLSLANTVVLLKRGILLISHFEETAFVSSRSRLLSVKSSRFLAELTQSKHGNLKFSVVSRLFIKSLLPFLAFMKFP